ncbi:MAG: hypothetical protein ACP5TV_13355 [Anaerolineae bacterium]
MNVHWSGWLMLLGWVLALAGAVWMTVQLRRPGEARRRPLDRRLRLIFSLAILLVGAAWLASESLEGEAPTLLGFAGAVFLLLVGSWHRAERRSPSAWLVDLVLAWTAVGIGAWGILRWWLG